ncbi:uncharacterized protein ISCGN_003682 [Ixodes scapularis]
MSLDNKPRNKGDPCSSHTSSPHNQQTQGPAKFMPSLASPLVPTQLRILQWNCRSLTKRKNEFQLRLAQHRHSYDAILMQETNVKDPRLSAYNYFHNPAIERKYTKTGPPDARGLATVYLKGTVPHAQIDTQKWCTPDQEVTAVRTLIDNHKLILVSAYVRPTAEDPNFSWIEELRTVYPDDRMVIGGDFNAHHREWGYDDDDQRGARSLEAYEKADGITASMLRNLPEEGKQQVLRWFNHMWETDTFPDERHESWVTPIPKAGKPPNTPKNTRPISLTSVMCKLFERIVLARITWIAEDRKLFHAAQTGFRQHLGTRDSLLLLSTDVYRKGSTCSLVAVDICKAFDLLPPRSDRKGTPRRWHHPQAPQLCEGVSETKEVLHQDWRHMRTSKEQQYWCAPGRGDLPNPV